MCDQTRGRTWPVLPPTPPHTHTRPGGGLGLCCPPPQCPHPPVPPHDLCCPTPRWPPYTPPDPAVESLSDFRKTDSAAVLAPDKVFVPREKFQTRGEGSRAGGGGRWGSSEERSSYLPSARGGGWGSVSEEKSSPPPQFASRAPACCAQLCDVTQCAPARGWVRTNSQPKWVHHASTPCVSIPNTAMHTPLPCGVTVGSGNFQGKIQGLTALPLTPWKEVSDAGVVRRRVCLLGAEVSLLNLVPPQHSVCATDAFVFHIKHFETEITPYGSPHDQITTPPRTTPKPPPLPCPTPTSGSTPRA